MKQYKAIARGYDGVKVREVGEVFSFAGKPGKWMEEVGAKKIDGEASKEGKPSDEKVEPKAKAHGKA